MPPPPPPKPSTIDSHGDKETYLHEQRGVLLQEAGEADLQFLWVKILQ